MDKKYSGNLSAALMRTSGFHFVLSTEDGALAKKTKEYTISGGSDVVAIKSYEGINQLAAEKILRAASDLNKGIDADLESLLDK